MHLVFLERVNEDGNFELTIKEGADELKEAIAGKFVFPQKMILTAAQKTENSAGLKDLLTGAFCIQEMPDVSFEVLNEEGDEIDDYKRSMYEGIGGPDGGGGGAGGGGCGGDHGGGGGHGGPPAGHA
ncbi:MAG: hypothetical protein V3T30_08020 [Thermodesulfobacteriota bacterium]